MKKYVIPAVVFLLAILTVMFNQIIFDSKSDIIPAELSVIVNNESEKWYESDKYLYTSNSNFKKINIDYDILVELDNGCSVYSKDKTTLYLVNQNNDIKDSKIFKQKITGLYKLNDNVIVQTSDNCYLYLTENHKLEKIKKDIPNTCIIYTIDDIFAYQDNNNIFILNGTNEKVIKLDTGYIFCGFWDDNYIVEAKSFFCGPIIKINVKSIKSGLLKKTYYIKTNSGYVNYMSIDTYKKAAILGSVNESGVIDIYYIDFTKNKYQITNVSTDCIKSVQLIY